MSHEMNRLCRKGAPARDMYTYRKPKHWAFSSKIHTTVCNTHFPTNLLSSDTPVRPLQWPRRCRHKYGLGLHTLFSALLLPSGAFGGYREPSTSSIFGRPTLISMTEKNGTGASSSSPSLSRSNVPWCLEVEVWLVCIFDGMHIPQAMRR